MERRDIYQFGELCTVYAIGNSHMISIESFKCPETNYETNNEKNRRR